MPQTFADAHATHINQQLVGDIGRLGLLMAGLGVGWRGLEGMANLTRRNLRSRRSPTNQTRYVDVVPLRQQEQEKLAVSSPIYHPLALPGFLAAGGLGLYGGYKATDFLLDRRRKQELERRLAQARQDYEAALHGSSKLGEDLSRLAELAEKRAMTPADLGGLLTGLSIAALGTGALGTGLFTYDMTKKRRADKIVEEARKRQARTRLRRMPPPIYARVESTPGASTVEGLTDLDKTAAVGG